MTRISLFILFALTMQTPCYADVTKLAAEHRKVLLDSSRFHELRSTTNLPPTVAALCTDGKGKLAEPGQKWQVTDIITDDSLPRKRLIWGVTDGEHYVVHYEQGGRGHSFHVLVATYNAGDSKAKVVWEGAGDQFKDYSPFLIALEKNKLDDAH
jgi:hypothetical protein